MPRFSVQIEGTSGNRQPFVELIEVDGENEQDANKKAREICIKAGPQGKLYKYEQGPEAMVWTIIKTTKK